MCIENNFESQNCKVGLDVAKNLATPICDDWQRGNYLICNRKYISIVIRYIFQNSEKCYNEIKEKALFISQNPKRFASFITKHDQVALYINKTKTSHCILQNPENSLLILQHQGNSPFKFKNSGHSVIRNTYSRNSHCV